MQTQSSLILFSFVILSAQGLDNNGNVCRDSGDGCGDAAILLQSQVGLQDKRIPSSNLEHTHVRKTVKEVFQHAHTDKLNRHGYHRYYETELAPYRDIQDVRVLEIGADSGKSLGAWLEYFSSPGAVQGIAYGVDEKAAKKTACTLFAEQCEKLRIYSMDQSNVSALYSLIDQNHDGWDIIIDDGSHKPQHQLISFQKLWPNLRPGGLYALEDIETSYVDDGTKLYGYTLNGGIGQASPNNAVEQFKLLVDVVNRKHFGHPEFTVFAGVDQDVARVTFADGLIFVQKKPSDPEWDQYPSHVVYTKSQVDRTFVPYNQAMKKVNSWFEKEA